MYCFGNTRGGDLGHNGSLVWESQTRSWLDDHPETNVVMWSWCGGCSDNTEEGINIYLNAMAQLELDFPQVTFIYMTGHLDGSGVGGTLYRNNNQIRDFCVAQNKVLFDFADIESWDPAGTSIPTKTTHAAGAATGARRRIARLAGAVLTATVSTVTRRARPSGG